MTDPATAPRLEHIVCEYDLASAENATITHGQAWRVRRQVVIPGARTVGPVLVALCPEKDDADEIAELLNVKYGSKDAPIDGVTARVSAYTGTPE